MGYMFAITTQHSEVVEQYIKNTNKRMESNNLLKNPFCAKIKEFFIRDTLNGMTRDYPTYLFYMRPLYPNVTFMGWITGSFLFAYFGFRVWMIPFFVLGCLGVFWNWRFYYMIAVLGLRKNGYKGTIKRIDVEKLIQKVYFDGVD